MAGCTVRVDQAALQSLVTSRDDLVDRELQAANVVVSGEIVNIRQVVDVIDFGLETFSLLKVVLDVEALDPGGIQVVANYFRDTELVPL